MEYVGRRIKREVLGGALYGSIESFNSSSGLFEVAYDGGCRESELLDLSQLSSILEPRDQRCEIVERCGNSSGLAGKEVKFDLDLNAEIDLNDEGAGCVNDHRDGIRFGMGSLDLNEGVSVVLPEHGVFLGTGEKKGIIDLNLDVDEDGFGVSRCEGSGRCFDLNLGLMDDGNRNSDGCEGQSGGEELGRSSDVILVNSDDDQGNMLSDMDIEKDGLLKDSVCGLDGSEDVAIVKVEKKRRGRKRKNALGGNVQLATPEAVVLDVENGVAELGLEGREETTVNDGGDLTYIENGNSESLSSVRRGRKRKVTVTNNQTLATPETGLRRSARRAKRTEFSSQDQISSEAELNDDSNHHFPSPSISALSSEKITVTGFRKKYSLLNDILPPKVDLPPSSRHLDLSGVPMFDLVSVYSFLRSFSTLLFLSPFELDDFVLAVKCTDSTLLFDSINVSLLRALRKQLEFLSSEGSASAYTCLRSLNWDFLDLITWPMFMVEYLIMHSPGYIPGLDISQLKVYQCDYYAMPVSAKVEILQHLCDDLVESEPFISEIRDRKLAAEQRTRLGRKVRSDSSRKRKSRKDASTSYDITKEVVEEPTDGNADDCFLCKNDGDLICCDGCPAAYHSRCVGVISSKLPEGKWYCPECSIVKDKPWMKIEMSYCGAELLGMDPYGRRFYRSCGYLLVLESSNDQYSYWCYNRDDLHLVISALDTPPFIYAETISAISKHWNVVREVGGHRSDLDTWSYSGQSAFPQKEQLDRVSRALDKNEVFAEKRFDEKSMVTSELEIAPKTTEVLETENIEMKADNHLASSEGSAEVTQSFVKTDYLSLTKTPDVPVDHSKKSAELFSKKGINNDSSSHAHNIGVVPLQVSNEMEYVNCYRYARTASSYYEQFTSTAKNSKDDLKSFEDILASQIKVVSNRFTEFSWTNVHNSDMNAKKEKCGWCSHCRFPEAEKECLFMMIDSFPSVEKFTSLRLGICKQPHWKNHFADLTCHLLCMEEHLQGLLVGPWLDPRYSMLWRKNVIGVGNVASFRDFLLKLESNVHHLALSADWGKHVDSVSTMGSAAHIIRNTAYPSVKRGSARKSAKSSDTGIVPSTKASTGLSLLWWRGGKCSRRLFSWKVLPRSLASKAARQGGSKKIPGILYPENGEHAKRTRRDAWRAAVETSTGVDQLALQVRELDANIKWDEIGNANSQFKLDKESIRADRSFKKAIIRRKCSEGCSHVKYLLDFGKRRFIPDVVTRHGTMFGDLSSEKKKFWLEELYVPLYLLKAYEEKQIARKYNKLTSIPSELRESSSVIKGPVEKKGFEYLFTRAERSENYQCAHCHKDVLIREAVSCQYCKEFFHKRHARKYSGSTATECAYSCHKCEGGHFVKAGSRNGKLELINLKNTSKKLKSLLSVKGKKAKKNKKQLKSKSKKGVSSVVIPLRRSARNAERKLKLSLRHTKTGKHKRTKRSNPEKPKLKKPLCANLLKRKRKMINNNSYWLNGLKLSRREDDVEVMQFRHRKLIVFPGEVSSFSDKPKCSICGELEPMSDTIYVACETCGAWFHGDALELAADKIEILSGFKCHKCLDKSPPVCPHQPLIGSNNDEFVSEQTSDAE